MLQLLNQAHLQILTQLYALLFNRIMLSMNYFVTCVFFMVVLITNACCHLDTQILVIKTDRKISAAQSTVLNTFEVGTQRKCALFCFGSNQCTCANYNAQSLQCQLNMCDVISQDTVIVEQGITAIFYGMWIQSGSHL